MSDPTGDLPVHVPAADAEPAYAADMSDIELRDRALAFIRKLIHKGSLPGTVQRAPSQAQYALLAHFDRALRTAILTSGVDGEMIRVCWRRGMIAFLEELEGDEVSVNQSEIVFRMIVRAVWLPCTSETSMTGSSLNPLAMKS